MANTAVVAKKLYVPIGLNLGLRLPEKEFKRLPKYYYFLDLLHRERVFNKEYRPDDYIRLKSEYLQRMLTTKEASTVIKDLEDWNIIQINHNFIRGKQSKSYRLTDQYRARQVVAVSLTDKVILKKLDLHGRIDYDPKYETLNWLLANYMDGLKLDFKAAYSHIYQKISKAPRLICSPFSAIFHTYLGRLGYSKVYKGNIKDKRTKPLSYAITFSPPLEVFGSKLAKVEEKMLFSPFHITRLAGESKLFKFSSFMKPDQTLRWFDFNRRNTGYQFKHFNCDLLALEMLNSRCPSNIIFKQDKVGNRLHTNLTNLNSELRQFLHHETGEELVNLDIRNSQPCIFGTLIKDYYKGKPMPEDARLYIELTRTGMFYEHVMAICGVPATKQARKQFKQQFFAKIFYCENLHMDKYADAQKFRAHFPNVYQIIREYKLKDYKQLSIQMQQRESRIIIDLVCSSLLKEFGPDFFCLTIHDSIVTVKSNQDIVKTRIEAIFTKEFGITPTINAETIN